MSSKAWGHLGGAPPAPQLHAHTLGCDVLSSSQSLLVWQLLDAMLKLVDGPWDVLNCQEGGGRVSGCPLCADLEGAECSPCITSLCL